MVSVTAFLLSACTTVLAGAGFIVNGEM